MIVWYKLDTWSGGSWGASEIERKQTMRKLLIGLSAAVAMAGGIAASTAPAEAKVHVFLGFGSPGYYDPGYGSGFYDPYYDPYGYDEPVYYHRRHHRHHAVNCHTVRRWHHHHWVWVKKCYRSHY
jgi:hypothetical protein